MTDAERAAALADEECTLDECPPGLFVFNGRVFLKSEYTTRTTAGAYQVDAYCLDSGEYFWGGASTTEARAALRVRPMSAEAVHRLAEQSAPSPAPADLREVVARALMLSAFSGSAVVDAEAFSKSAVIPDYYTDMTDAAISAISAAGYAIMPREPTEAMIERTARALCSADSWREDGTDFFGDMPNWRNYEMPARLALRAAIAAKEGKP